MKNESVIIIGGDERQEYIYKTLSADGYRCEAENCSADCIEKKLSECKYVVLPVPTSKDGKTVYCKNENFILSYKELTDMLTDRHVVFAGGFNKELKEIMQKNDISYYDLNDSEEFLTYNAFLTAQGALKLLLDNTRVSLNRKEILITGFGRIAKALANMFNALNLSVTVCIRNKNQFNLAECMGFNAVRYDVLKDVLYDSDFIFNTVPGRIFSREHIKSFKSGAVYFELASAPYGVDRTLFENTDALFIDGGALPGKYAPHSAGEKIAKIIENLIQGSDSNGKET